jgi:hypothetical protein
MSPNKKSGEQTWVKMAGSTADTPQEYYKMMQRVRSGKVEGN